MNTVSEYITQQLEPGEEVLWFGMPKAGAYTMSKCLALTPIALLWLLVDGIMIGVLATNFDDMGAPSFLPYFLVGFFAIHLTPVWIWLFKFIKSIKERKNMQYALTDRRILFQFGQSVPVVNSVFYSSIRTVGARVNRIDSMLKVGDIYLHTDQGKAVLYDIDDVQIVNQEIQFRIREAALKVEQAFVADDTSVKIAELERQIEELKKQGRV